MMCGRTGGVPRPRRSERLHRLQIVAGGTGLTGQAGIHRLEEIAFASPNPDA